MGIEEAVVDWEGIWMVDSNEGRRGESYAPGLIYSGPFDKGWLTTQAREFSGKDSFSNLVSINTQKQMSVTP